MKKRLLALILAVIMVTSMLPLSASAVTGTESISTATGWYWPLPANNQRITSGFGASRGGSLHQGIDIGASSGTNIYAARAGVVYLSGWHQSMGNYVSIRHGLSNGKYIFTTYMHMTKRAVAKGEEVDQNTVIGYVGSTGDSSGPHLHFHIFVSNSKSPSSVSPSHKNNNDLKNNYINPSSIQYDKSHSGGSGPVGKTSTPSVSVDGQNITVSWSYSGSGTSIAVYLVQEPWAWADIKHTQVVSPTSTSCTFTGLAPGNYCAFTIAQPNAANVQSEWTGFTIQEPHTNHSNGGFRYTASEHPHYNYYSCSVCGQDFTDGSTERNNNCAQCHWEHVWDEGKITQEPSASQPGIRTFTCTICGETKTETIEAGISGTCGDNLIWSYANGILSISGTGPMWDFERPDESVLGWEENGPWGNTQNEIREIRIEQGVTSIGELAFFCCENLRSVTIPGSVTRIGQSAFWYCESLAGVTLPNSVTSIGAGAFQDCTSLTSITIPDSVTSIEDYAFSYCKNLTSVTLPNSVTNIGKAIFIGCNALTSVTIPDSVTSIGDDAFYDTSLTNVYYAGTKAQWEDIAVGNGNESLYNARIHYAKEDTPTPTPDPIPVPTPAPTPGNPGGPGGFDPTPEPEEPPTVTFQDVPASAYYAQAVSWAVANGITSGVGPGQFGPDMRCTRAQMVTFLWKAQGQPEPESAENPFVDVKPSDYCYKAVLWAVENGISGGTDSTHFSPSLSCDRSQAVTFIWRTEGKPEAETRSSFSDVSSKSYYAKAIDWAVEYGIVNGVGGGKYDPKGVCSRAQIVTMLYRDAGN